jgi:P-type Ca2+ transporter type 2C
MSCARSSAFNDRTFVITSLLSAVAIILATESQFLHRILDTVELTGNQWLICIGAGLTIAVASEIRKLLLRRRAAADQPGVPETNDDAVAAA